MSQFGNACLAYREPSSGMLSLHLSPKDHSCDNGLLFSSIYMILLHRQFDVSREEWEHECKWFQELVRSCYVPGNPGLLCRYPGQWGPGKDEQHDDYRGVLAACANNKITDIPNEIFNYGLKNGFCYNTEVPGRWDANYWFGRYPGFVALVEATALGGTDTLNEISFLTSCLGILKEAKDDTTSMVLQWLGCLTMEKRGLIPFFGIWFWRYRAKQKWDGGLAEVFAEYFGLAHPFTKFAFKDFL